MAKLTPEVAADLAKLNAIPDDVIREAARDAWVKQFATSFQVPVAVAQMRLEGVGPYRSMPDDQ